MDTGKLRQGEGHSDTTGLITLLKRSASHTLATAVATFAHTDAEGPSSLSSQVNS